MLYAKVEEHLQVAETSLLAGMLQSSSFIISMYVFQYVSLSLSLSFYIDMVVSI